jgi:predicted lactoylglutathione lyase
MIGYVTVGVSDMEKSAAFYDAVFSELGIGRMMEMDGFIMWGTDMTSCGFCIMKPYDGKAMTAGNGTMFGVAAKSKADVDKVYARAIAEGGTCEGKPGPRGDESMGFYAGYFRDPDGNKLDCYVFGG